MKTKRRKLAAIMFCDIEGYTALMHERAIRKAQWAFQRENCEPPLAATTKLFPNDTCKQSR